MANRRTKRITSDEHHANLMAQARGQAQQHKIETNKVVKSLHRKRRASPVIQPSLKELASTAIVHRYPREYIKAQELSNISLDAVDGRIQLEDQSPFVIAEIARYRQTPDKPNLWMPPNRWIALSAVQRAELRAAVGHEKLVSWWFDVLGRMNLEANKSVAPPQSELTKTIFADTHKAAPDLAKPVPRSTEYEAAMRARLADDDEDESPFVVAEKLDPLADVKTSGVEKLSPHKFPKPTGRASPDSTTATVMQYRRDASVRAWVLNNARGVCECCNQDAPFKGTDGLPYLEVHHVRQLAACGSDTVSNTVAICPNCHRELHFGENSQALVLHLLESVARLVRE